MTDWKSRMTKPRWINLTVQGNFCESDTFPPLPCTRGRGIGGEGRATGRALGAAISPQTPHPRPHSPAYRGAGSRAVLLCLLIVTSSPYNLAAASFSEREEAANPLYEVLQKEGLTLVGGKKVPLSPPFMADGLDAAKQREILETLVSKRFPVEEFTAKLGTAPHFHRIRKIAAEGPSPLALVVDIAFVAHGSLDAVADRDFLEKLHKKSKDRRIHLLTAKELEKRKLKVESNRRCEERYSHGTFTILDRVELRAALHTAVARHSDSLLAATLVDSSFADDADFPNRWRKISFDDEGQRRFGPAHPYSGAGGYLKVTRLHEPAGALFLEYHLVYSEPKSWFNDADPLTPKLPAIIQSEVRSFRRELNAVKK